MNDYFYCIAECDCINKGKLQKVTQIMIFKKIERLYEGRGDKIF